jgi:FKBP-type peptidyl-prolyl cis-trans isomerase SlyD
MKIGADKVVSVEYTLRNEAGEILDTNEGQEPLAYLHGHGEIVLGLERALEGKEVGDSLRVTVDSADGYGPHDEEKVIRVPRAALPAGLDLEIGMLLVAEGPNGEQFPLRVVGLSSQEATLDGNHPLAGQTLHFEVRVREVREATEGELEHGHAHPAGHEH